MTPTGKFDVIVVGGEGDALVAAIVLARAGRHVLHLVRDENVAGMNGSIEIAPGFRAPLEGEASWIPPAVIRELQLPITASTSPQIPASVALPDGGFLSLPGSPTAASAAIKAHSPRDAERWPKFAATMRELAGFLEALYQTPPTDIDGASLGELPALLSLGRSFRSLGKANMSELLRVMPMPAQDLADEWFTFDPLKAAIGAAATRDIRQGPRSGGTSFVLLHYLTGAANGALRGRAESVIGSSGSGTTIAWLERLAGLTGVTLRKNASVARIAVRNDAVTGVTLTSGEEMSAPVVLSTEDPSRTFLQMVDPVWLDPEFMLAVKNIKFRGATAVVHFAIDGVPDAPGLADPTKSLAGVVSLSTNLDAIEKAYDAVKYGAMPDNPHITFSMPTLRADEYAPGHVGVATVQFVPYALRGSEWTPALSTAIAETVTAALTRLMPKFADHVLHRAVMTPPDVESRFGLTEGAVTQGEITLDQILFMRPVAGWGQYATPIDGLYVAGSGTHPGPGVMGASGLLAAKRVLRDGKKR